MLYSGTKMEPKLINFVNIMEVNIPGTIDSMTKFILHGLNVYKGHLL